MMQVVRIVRCRWLMDGESGFGREQAGQDRAGQTCNRAVIRR